MNKNILDKLYFAKINPDAIIPSKNEDDGCYDCYACFGEDSIMILPDEIKLIPTGIASAFDKKYRLSVRERGSSGSKGLSVRAGQIDSGYRGEIFIAINNTTDKIILIQKEITGAMKEEITEGLIIYPYDKAICQLALEVVPQVQVEEISYEDLLNIESDRSTGCLGSSGK